MISAVSVVSTLIFFQKTTEFIKLIRLIICHIDSIDNIIDPATVKMIHRFKHKPFRNPVFILNRIGPLPWHLNSPDSPPPRPCPLLLCKMKNGLARSDTHSAPASSTSSGWIHISGRSLLTDRWRKTGREDRDSAAAPSNSEKHRGDVDVFAQSGDCTSLPGLTPRARPLGRLRRCVANQRRHKEKYFS